MNWKVKCYIRSTLVQKLLLFNVPFLSVVFLWMKKFSGPIKLLSLVDNVQELLEIGATSLSKLGCLLSLGSIASKWPSWGKNTTFTWHPTGGSVWLVWTWGMCPILQMPYTLQLLNWSDGSISSSSMDKIQITYSSVLRTQLVVFTGRTPVICLLIDMFDSVIGAVFYWRIQTSWCF
jgi:hypothetical protein